MSSCSKSKLDGCTGKAKRLRISIARYLRRSPIWHGTLRKTLTIAISSRWATMPMSAIWSAVCIDHLRQFLLELGVGFAFVGSQYRLTIGNEDFFIDLLFYHLKLRAFVVGFENEGV